MEDAEIKNSVKRMKTGKWIKCKYDRGKKTCYVCFDCLHTEEEPKPFCVCGAKMEVEHIRSRWIVINGVIRCERCGCFGGMYDGTAPVSEIMRGRQECERCNAEMEDDS